MTSDRDQPFQPETPAHPRQLDLFCRETGGAHFPPAGGLGIGESETGEHGLYRICHDMRTALNAILGFSEIMTQKLHGPLGHPKYEEYAAHVRFSGQALLSVSDEVLSLAGRAMLAGGRRAQSA